MSRVVGVNAVGERQVWARRETVLWRRVADDVVLLPPEQDEPFTLSAGATLWQELARPVTVDELARRLAEVACVATATVRAELDDVLSALVHRRAVEGRL